MNLQSILNNEALNQLQSVKKIIENSESFEANQMKNYAIRKCLDSLTPICNMTDSELKEFEHDIIRAFEYHGWV